MYNCIKKGTKKKMYRKEYYEENKDLIKEINKRYYEKNKDKYKEWNKKWREEHKKEFAKLCRESRRKRVEELRANGVCNAWGVVIKGEEPRYERKKYERKREYKED